MAQTQTPQRPGTDLTDLQLQRLAKAVKDSDVRDPWCCGTFNVPVSTLKLFYQLGDGPEAKWVFALVTFHSWTLC